MPEQDQTSRKWAAEIRVTITVPPDWTRVEEEALAAKLEQVRMVVAEKAGEFLPRRCSVDATVA